MDERTYDLNELAQMTGFTTRTLRTYLKQGLLHGEKVGGVWRFTPEELDKAIAVYHSRDRRYGGVKV